MKRPRLFHSSLVVVGGGRGTMAASDAPLSNPGVTRGRRGYEKPEVALHFVGAHRVGRVDRLLTWLGWHDVNMVRSSGRLGVSTGFSRLATSC